MTELPFDKGIASGAGDRRSGGDRRRRRMSDLRWLFRMGRRRGVRRGSDRLGLHFMDYYSPRIFYVLVLVLLLSVADAFLTLWLMDNGAVELNPVMAYFLAVGDDAFLAAKYFLTSLSVIIAVVLHYAFLRHFGVHLKLLLHLFAGCFAAVVVWEIFLAVRYVL
jgi:hypothetical protein